MNPNTRATLERELASAENALAAARSRGQSLNEQLEDYMAKIGPNATVARLDGDLKLNRLISAQDKALTEINETQEKRDGILRELAKNPLAPLIGEHRHTGESTDHGVGIGFTMADLEGARAQLLGANPAPVRLGPPRIIDPRQSQAGAMDFMATTGGVADYAEAGVASYRLDVLFPYLRERPSVADMFPARGIDRYSEIAFKVMTPANQAAPVLEGGTKPTSTPQTEQVEVVPQVVAHIGTFTRQVLYNFPGFLDQLTSEFMAGLLLAVDVQLLSGDGTAPQLNGIIGEPGVGTYIRDTSNETRVDALLSGITKVRTSAYVDPTHLVIHPADLEATRKEKASVGGLYTVAPMAQLDEVGLPNRLWGLQVVPTTSIPEGKALVINPELYGYMVYRQPAVLEINPYEGWDTNEYGIRCEWWGNLACIHPQAACLVEDL